MSQLDLPNLIAQFQAAQNAANQANLARYQEQLASIRGLGDQLTGTYGQAEALLENLGQSAREDVGRRGEQVLQKGQQDLISAGLFGTTMAPNLRRAVAEDTGRQERAITEDVSARRAGVLGQRAGAELSVGDMLQRAIAARSDIGPDLSTYASLIQAAAAAGDPNRRLNVSVPRSTGTGAGRAAGGGGGFSPAGTGGGGGFGTRGGSGSQVSGTGAMTITQGTQGARPGSAGFGGTYANLGQGLQQVTPSASGELSPTPSPFQYQAGETHQQFLQRLSGSGQGAAYADYMRSRGLAP